MNAHFLGIDIGTSSSKGVLVAEDGQIVARAERSHRLSLPHPGWAEHDAEAIWWGDFAGIARELMDAGRGPILALAISGIGPCLLPVDGAGKPLRPAILYGIDTRATAEIDELTVRYGADVILRRGGSALSSQAVGPKLAWLRRHEPDVWSRTRRFHMANSFILERLSGEYVLDHHSASQCDPFYDLVIEDWASDWTADIAPGLELPRLAWSDEIVGTVSDSAAAATGIPIGTPVAAGTIDAWAEALSVGVRAPGDAMLMYGTTMFIVAVAGQPTPHPTIWTTAGVSAGSRTLAAGMATSGALTGWFRDLVGDVTFEELLAEAATVPPGSDGLVVLPYFAGERTPIFDPAARGLILGLTLRHGRGAVYRALLEATGYGVRHILEAMAEAGARTTRLVAVGGGTRGGIWTQIVSDVTERRQEVPREAVGAAYGDAMLAAMAIGHREAADWNEVVERVDPYTRETYARLYRIYRELYPATLDAMHELAAIQEAGAAP